MGGSPPDHPRFPCGAVVGEAGVPPSGTPSPVGRHAGDERGHPTGHVWVNTPHVGSRKDRGRVENDPGSGQNPPTHPTLFPPSRGRGLGMDSTGGTGKIQTQGLWGEGALGLPLPLRTSPNPNGTEWERIDYPSPIAVGSKGGLGPPALPPIPPPQPHSVPPEGRQGYGRGEGRAGGLGWGVNPMSYGRLMGGCSVPGPAPVSPRDPAPGAPGNTRRPTAARPARRPSRRCRRSVGNPNHPRASG